jgi:ferrochelatase
VIKTAVILMNLGTPQEPTTASVKRFLKEFLSDRRVVEFPRFVWWFILHLIILPFRSPKVAKAYQSIWGEEGSPLRYITVQQVEKLQDYFDQDENKQAPVVSYAMTYGGPYLADVVSELQQDGIERFILIPLYPQFSATTTGSIFDQVSELYQSSRNIPDIRIVKDYCHRSEYLDALANSVEVYWQRHGKAERLLMSFHGLPQAYVDKGDPYYQQCVETAEAVAQRLSLAEDQWQISFQSRLGRSQWLQPYTSEVLKQWGQEKLQGVDVICPAFATDCLETLEEISEENKAIFIQSGGKDFRYIPCLNDSDAHIALLKTLSESLIH